MATPPFLPYPIPPAHTSGDIESWPLCSDVDLYHLATVGWWLHIGGIVACVEVEEKAARRLLIIRAAKDEGERRAEARRKRVNEEMDAELDAAHEAANNEDEDTTLAAVCRDALERR